MVHHLGFRIDDNADRLAVALKIRNQHFDAASLRLTANLLDHHREDARTTDQVVVAIHTGNDCVLKAECRHSLSNAARFVHINGLRPAFWHSAESAAPRAEVAEHHERRRLVMPALADVGALRAFAHRVQSKRTRQAL